MIKAGIRNQMLYIFFLSISFPFFLQFAPVSGRWYGDERPPGIPLTVISVYPSQALSESPFYSSHHRQT